MHQHRYLGVDQRVLGIRERDVRLASGNFCVSWDGRAVSAEHRVRSRRRLSHGGANWRGERAGCWRPALGISERSPREPARRGVRTPAFGQAETGGVRLEVGWNFPTPRN